MNPSDARTVELLEDIRDLLKTDIKNLLRRIEKNTRSRGGFAVAFKFETYKLTTNGRIRTDKMNLLLGEDAEINITGIVDGAGNPAQIEGDKVAWSVSGDQGLGDLEVSADSKSVKFVRNGKLGTCAIEARGDADLGPDEDIIVGSVELVCLGGKAVKFELDAKAVPHA